MLENFQALNMIFAGIMLRVAYKKNLRVLSTLFLSGTTLILESFVYAIVFQFFNIDSETRGFIVRVMIIAISMSFYLPLFVSYLRSRN
ncbi:MAG: hypothetical protein AABZ14_04175, partial [Candidatus Margulisiibacteriota bacterium]